MSIPADQIRSFRNALGAFATGVTVVTTRSGEGGDVGLTANSFNSVSLDPPMVLWSLAKTSKSLSTFMTASYFAVHVLASDQEALSARFARPASDKFADLPIDRGVGAIPLLTDCSARFQCRTAFRYEGGDHMIFVGQVEAFDHWDRPPLVYHAGRYASAVRVTQPQAARSDAEPDSSFSQDFLIYLLGRAHHQLFLQLRNSLRRYGLSEDGWFVLSLLGVANNRTIEELGRLLAYTGKGITYDLLASLGAAGFVKLAGFYDPHARVELTDTGRKVVIELVAAARAAEDHAQRNLESSQTRVLKCVLRQIIDDSQSEHPIVAPSLENDLDE
jgi:3-hydroxy-9,10-secoandrosta-1,3,5(10)-triene-9,17-dione monooxygenase reductase component